MQPAPPYGAPPPSTQYPYAMPPPGYGPQPGYYPPPPPPAFHTREGVKYFSYALLMEIIVGVVGFILAIAAIGMILSLGTGNWQVAWGALVGLAAAGIAILVLVLLFIIFALLGIIKFALGRNEFGPEHAKNFLMAIIFFILGIVIPMVGGAFNPSADPRGSVDSVYSSIRTGMIVSGVVGIVGPVFTGLGLITLVKQFTTDEAPKFRLALILLIVGPIIGLAAMVAIFPAKPGSGVGVLDLSAFMSVAVMGLSLGGVVSLLGYFFFYGGYKTILEKMNAGVIQPGMPPAQSFPPGYAPPPVPPQPYQPPPPGAPAPYQPPPPGAPAPYQPPPPQ